MRDLPNKLDVQLAGYYIEGKTFVKLVKTERGREGEGGRGGGGKESVIAMYWPCICGLLTYSKLNMVYYNFYRYVV